MPSALSRSSFVATISRLLVRGSGMIRGPLAPEDDEDEEKTGDGKVAQGTKNDD